MSTSALAGSPDWLPLVGGEVRIRPFIERDLHHLFELETDPWVKMFIAGGALKTPKAQWLAGADEILVSPIQYCIASAATDEFYGRASLGHFRSASDREIQVLLKREVTGRGLGEEVCRMLISAANIHLGAKSIFAKIHRNHRHSIALVQRLGFSKFETVDYLGIDVSELTFVLRLTSAS